MGISTHALTWRATIKLINEVMQNADFYPRPHMEGDRRQDLSDRYLVVFLPTPSHGGRPS